MKRKSLKTINLKDTIYPLTNLPDKTYQICDHINLSGENPLIGPQFVSLTNIYLSRKGIVVAHLKNGIHPRKHEKKILLKAGAKAYSYKLIPKVIKAAKNGYKVKATGIVMN